jgi:hypothetical protein
MREVTKSLFSFSWAISLLGAKQAGNLMCLTDQNCSGSAPAAFDSITQVAVAQLDEPLRRLFLSGDALQKSLIDTTFKALSVGGLTCENLNPILAFVDVARRFTRAVWQPSRGGNPSAPEPLTPAGNPGQRSDQPGSPGSGPAGWGPMPRNS